MDSKESANRCCISSLIQETSGAGERNTQAAAGEETRTVSGRCGEDGLGGLQSVGLAGPGEGELFGLADVSCLWPAIISEPGQVQGPRKGGGPTGEFCFWS